MNHGALLPRVGTELLHVKVVPYS